MYRPLFLFLVAALFALPSKGQEADPSFAFRSLTTSYVDGPYIAGGTSIDYDSDGDLDIVYPARYDLIVLENDGTGVFTRNDGARVLDSDQLIDWPRDLAVADFDGDGRDDLFIADHGDEPADQPWLGGQSQLFLQNEDGQLVEVTSTHLPQERTFTHAAAVGDINGDGALDIYLAGYIDIGSHPKGHFWINDGTGRFTSGDLARTPTDVHFDHPAAALADVDLDGDMDLVLGGSPWATPHDRLLLNDGTGYFSDAPHGAMPPRYAESQPGQGDYWNSEWATWNIEAADFNGDGYPDLVMSTLFDFTSVNGPGPDDWEETRAQLLLNNGDGTFRDASHLIPQHHPRVVDWAGEGWIVFSYPADLNGDGWIDLVTAGQFIETRLFYNVGGEYFVDGSDAAAPDLGDQWSSVVPADFTGDGATDIALLTSADGRHLAVQTAPWTFDPAWAPAITSLSASEGEPGETITVYGDRIGDATRAWVGEQETTLTVVGDGEVQVTIPEEASTAPIRLMAPFGYAESAQDFVISQAPSITSLSATVAAPGTTISIYGSRLDATTAVHMGGVSMPFHIASASELRVTVSDDAESGMLRVTTPFGEAETPFVVFRQPAGTVSLVFDNALAVGPAAADASALNLGAAFTMETWVYLDRAMDYAHFMGKPHSQNAAPWTSYHLGIRDGRLALEQSSGASDSHRWVQAPEAAPVGRWVHVAGTLDAGMLRLYVDGDLVAESESAGPSDNDVLPFTLGAAYTADGRVDGSVDGEMRRARVWGRALSEVEIATSATSELTGDELGLVANWPLDDGEGDSARDLGPNGYNMSLGLNGAFVPSWNNVGVATDETASQPNVLALDSYPNPFQARTTLRYTLPAAGHVRVEVVDVLGRRTALLVDRFQQSGEHEIAFDADGHANGPYFAIVTVGAHRAQASVLLVR